MHRKKYATNLTLLFDYNYTYYTPLGVFEVQFTTVRFFISVLHGEYLR